MDDVHSALRDDVRLLGDLLGETLRDQEGPWLLSLVEEIRLLAKNARSGHADKAEQLVQKLAGLDDSQWEPVARAFSHFLNLANIAEQYHQVRRRRDYQQTAAESATDVIASKGPDKNAQPQPQPQQEEVTLNEVIPRLLKQGISPEQISNSLSTMSVDLVLTAHPTEVTRRTLIRKYDEISDCLHRLDTTLLTPNERQTVLDELRRKIVSAWHTDEIRRDKPTPVDEARWGFVSIEQNLWQAVPKHLREIDRVLESHGLQVLPLPAIPVRFSSWMGGDRDGNPNVTAKVTEEVLLLARWMAADLLRRDIEALHMELSMQDCSDALRDEAERLRVGKDDQPRVEPSREPYRVILKHLRQRIDDTLVWAESELAGQFYSGPMPMLQTSELLRPLMLCFDSLNSCGMEPIAQGELLDTIRRLHCFGVTLLTLDIRQESTRHADVMDCVTQYLGLGEYHRWDEAKKQQFLIEELTNNRPLIPTNLPATGEVTEVLSTFAAIARQSSDALGAYVISMATHPSDVLAVILLQKEAGVKTFMRVVPLFETLADLQGADQTLEALLAIPWYRNHIDGKQEIMIGYSDSAKDAGFMAASWAQYQTQEKLVAIAKQHDVHLTLFHGRGGSASRGGAPSYEAILSQPAGSVNGSLRITEQGEVIRAKFSPEGVAIRTLERYVSATLEATLLPRQEPKPEWRAHMDAMSKTALATYRQVIREDKRFIPYFRSATPEQELQRLALGSRPAKRNAAGGIESLRAIPWVFAWTQMRLMLPAWLGTEAALSEALQQGKSDDLREMLQQWPYFKMFFSMLEMVLAKGDLAIAAYYEQRLADSENRSLGEELRARFVDAVDITQNVLERSMLLQNNPAIRHSIKTRNPYLDPLHVLQVELMRRAREAEAKGEEVSPELAKALMVTVAGIAAGMRNTG